MSKSSIYFGLVAFVLVVDCFGVRSDTIGASSSELDKVGKMVRALEAVFVCFLCDGGAVCDFFVGDVLLCLYAGITTSGIKWRDGVRRNSVGGSVRGGRGPFFDFFEGDGEAGREGESLSLFASVGGS